MKKFSLLLLSALFGALLFCSKVSASPRLIIIIDDLGNSFHLGKAVIDLPADVNVAILPHRPYSKKLAEYAYQQGKDVLLHQPMSNHSGKDPGLGNLHEAMNKQQLIKQLLKNIQSVPHTVGINNHMGSALTSNALAMNWLMEGLSQQQLFFVDSRTTGKTLAYRMAQKYQIPTAQRHIFLDNLQDQRYIRKQIEKAISYAKKHGEAFVIGHPYPTTIEVLKQHLAAFPLRNIKISSVSQQMAHQKIVSPSSARCQSPMLCNQQFKLPQRQSALLNGTL